MFFNIFCAWSRRFWVFFFKRLQRINCRHLTKVSVREYFFLSLYFFLQRNCHCLQKHLRFFMSGTLIILRQNCHNPDYWRFIRCNVTIMVYWHFRCRQKTVVCNRRHELALIIVALTGTCSWRKREKEKMSILLVQTFQIWFH